MRRFRRITGSLFLIALLVGVPAARARRRIVRHQDQENLRTDADAGAAKAAQELDGHEEKGGRGKIADAKAVAFSREISFASLSKKRKSPRVPARREARAESLPLRPGKRRLRRLRVRILAECFSQKEEETQIFSFADSTPEESPTPSPSPSRHSRSMRKVPAPRRHLLLPKEKRGAGHRRGQRDRWL